MSQTPMEDKPRALPPIGSNIRKWRTLRDIKQADFARKLNIAASTLSKYENNRTTINLVQVQQITILLDISFTQLLEGPDKEEK